MNEKEIIEDFLDWCRLARNTYLQEMPEWTQEYWPVDEEQLINEYLEKDDD